MLLICFSSFFRYFITVTIFETLQIEFFEFYFNESKERLKGSFITLAAFGRNEIIRTIEKLYGNFSC